MTSQVDQRLKKITVQVGTTIARRSHTQQYELLNAHYNRLESAKEELNRLKQKRGPAILIKHKTEDIEFFKATYTVCLDHVDKSVYREHLVYRRRQNEKRKNKSVLSNKKRK